MICLQSLRLQDFQTYKDCFLEFSPNFNCIVGPTRSGKSSTVRALDFLFYNEWEAIYQRFFSLHTTLTAKFTNGITLVRTKGDGINRITVIDEKGNQLSPWDNFGRSLPREVLDILGIRPIEIDTETSINANVADQDQSLFLLYSTPESKTAIGTLRTKILSRLSGLHWIDYALRDLNGDRKDISTTIQELKNSNRALETKLSDYLNLGEYDNKIQLAKERLKKVKMLLGALNRIEDLKRRTQQWKENYQKFQELKLSSTAVKRLRKIVSLYERYLKLKDFVSKLNNLDRSIENLSLRHRELTATKATVAGELDLELSKNPICVECGAAVDPIKFKKTI